MLMISSFGFLAGGGVVSRFFRAARTAARTSSSDGMKARARKIEFGRRSCIFLHVGPASKRYVSDHKDNDMMPKPRTRPQTLGGSGLELLLDA